MFFPFIISIYPKPKEPQNQKYLPLIKYFYNEQPIKILNHSNLRYHSNASVYYQISQNNAKPMFYLEHRCCINLSINEPHKQILLSKNTNMDHKELLLSFFKVKKQIIKP